MFFFFIKFNLAPPTKKPKVEAEIITIDSSDDDDEDDDDEDDDEENNANGTQQRSSTPVLSSGSSTSETPNLLSLPSPDSSTESSLTHNNNIGSRTNNSLPIDNSPFSDILYGNCAPR